MQQFQPYFPGYGNSNQQQPQQQSNTGQQQQSQQQPINLGGSNLAIYGSMPMPVVSGGPAHPGFVTIPIVGTTEKPKRKQVKNACVNCQKACKKCDEERPCQRCIKYGIPDTCINSVRKERKKGIKRGPYKKRNANSASSSGASTPNPVPTANVYGQSMGYAPFNPQPPYDPYGYVNNGQMMPQAYMVPTTIPQMYPSNPSVLSYQAMNMGGFRPQEPPSDVNAKNNNSSTAGTPNDSTPATTSTEVKEGDEDDDENKLTILSQLCSAVLDNNGAPKQELKTEEQSNTPPPSRPHSREPSHENNNNNITLSNIGHTYPSNGHLSHLSNSNSAYRTPGSSPADSPLQFNKQNWTSEQQPQTQQQQ